jgi:hypothetical protein
MHPSVAKQAAEKLGIPGGIERDRPSGAEAHVDFVALAARLKPCPGTKRLWINVAAIFARAVPVQEPSSYPMRIENKGKKAHSWAKSAGGLILQPRKAARTLFGSSIGIALRQALSAEIPWTGEIGR